MFGPLTELGADAFNALLFFLAGFFIFSVHRVLSRDSLPDIQSCFP
jgi:hypothetical protein